MQPDAPADPKPPHKPDFAAMGKAGWLNRPVVAYTCQYCQKACETKLPQTAKWCSNACNWRAHREKGMYDRQVKCAVCDTEFTARPNRGKRFRNTCSVPCRNILVGQKNAKLDQTAIEAIRAYSAEGKSQRWIANAFKCSQNVISGIIRRKSFKWVPEAPAPEHGSDTPEPGGMSPSPAISPTPQTP